MTTVAGMPGVVGSVDGTGSGALFNIPGGVAVDSSGNLYVADTFNNTIRKGVPAANTSSTSGNAGSNPTVSTPSAATVTVGHTVTISATGSGSTFQWQVSADNGTTWSNLSNGSTYSGATTSMLTIANATAAMNGSLYRVVVDSSTTSSSTTLTVATA